MKSVAYLALLLAAPWAVQLDVLSAYITHLARECGRRCGRLVAGDAFEHPPEILEQGAHRARGAAEPQAS